MFYMPGRVLTVAVTALVVWLSSTQADAQTVHVALIVPADRATRFDYQRGLDVASRDIQAWFQGQLGNFETFTLDPAGVRILQSTRSADWFSTNPNGALFTQFFDNVVSEAEALLGLRLGSSNTPDVWALYVDADPRCGQCGGCGGGRIVVIGKNDLRGLAGEPFVPGCPGDFDPATNSCRWIGGLGHELGHAFGLPHPPGCDARQPTCDTQALMWNGFRSYGATYLRPEERSQLRSSGFVVAQPPLSFAAPCHANVPGVPPPSNLTVQSNGLEVTLRWNGSPQATDYIVEAGSGPALANLFNASIGNVTTLTTLAPPGRYYVRVRARSAAGTSAPSNEVVFTVGSTPCTSPPPPPSGLTHSKSGLSVTVSWGAIAESASYVLEAGSAPGLSNLFNMNIGSSTALTATAGPGQYFVRVRAVNACGVGNASAEIAIVLP